MANFPAGPINGQTTTVNGIVYIYDDTKTAWKRSTSFGGNLTILGNITSANVITGNVYTSSGIYWSGNGAAYSSGGGGGGSSNFLYTASASAPGSPTKGDQWFDTTDGTLYEYMDDGDSFQWVDIQTPTLASNAVITSLSGNVSTNGNISASSVIITSGIFWSNGTPFASSIYSDSNVEAYIGGNVGTLFLGNLSTQANLGAFQIFSNTNAATQTTSINTINANIGAFYAYANTKIGTNTNSNLVVVATTTSTSTTTGALVVGGGAGVAGNLYIGGIIDATGNIVADSGVASSSSTTGALIVNGGAGVSGNLFVIGNVVLGSGTASNVVANATTTSTSTTTGALVVRGGVGIAGNVYANGSVFLGAGVTSNLVANATTTSTSTTTGALVVRGGAGVAGNVYTDKVYTTNGIYWSGNGVAFSSGGGGSPFASNIVITSGTATTNTTTGAIVVTGSGGLAVGGVGIFGGNLVAAATTSTSSVTTGALVVKGGVGIAGGMNIGSDVFLTSGFLQTLGAVTSTSASTGAITTQNGGGLGVGGNLYVGNEFVVPGGGKITSTGLAYLLEKVTVTAGAPSGNLNIDMSTQSVMYWTGNATANVSANIRGTATQPLNSLLATGQSVTAVIFLPNGPSNFLVTNVYIDNTTVSVAYQGNAAPALGNSNSIDIYSFTILKTASATYKVFASQTQFMHPG